MTALGMMHLVKNKVTDPVNLGSGSGIKIKEIADNCKDLIKKLNGYRQSQWEIIEEFLYFKSRKAWV